VLKKKISISNTTRRQHDAPGTCSTGLSPGATDITPLRGWGGKSIISPRLVLRGSTCVDSPTKVRVNQF